QPRALSAPTAGGLGGGGWWSRPVASHITHCAASLPNDSPPACYARDQGDTVGDPHHFTRARTPESRGWPTCHHGRSMAMREERKVVTALFADLAGSTSLGEQLDPEDVKVVVGEAAARIVHTGEDFGGTVKDLAGDGVLALFGAPTAHEDDPERAVRSGLKIVADLGDYAREVAQAWGVDGFGVRVGVDTGPVALGPVGS